MMKSEISQQLDANIIEKLVYLPSCLRMNVKRTAEMVTVNTGFACDMFNVVCILENGVDLQIFSNIFAENLPFACWLGFGNDISVYEKYLKQLNGTKVEIESGMSIEIREINTISSCSKLKIKSVSNLEKLQDFIKVYKKIIPEDAYFTEKFYIAAAPFILDKHGHLELFVGYLSERPVATGALFFSENVVGVWDITVLPEFRRRGIATDMIRRMLLHAQRDKNCNRGVLTATENGEKVYRKMGFQKIKEFVICNF